MMRKYSAAPSSQRGSVLGILVVITTYLLGSSPMANAESQANELHVKESAAIEALVAAETDAWNRGDAKAFAAPFTADGSFTNIIGMVYYGREEFEERHAQIFKTIYKGSVLKQSIGKLRFVRPDVAIVDINVELSGVLSVPPGVRTDPDHVIRTKLQLVLVNEKGDWWITAYHNVAVSPKPTAAPR
jgi:uncharacterized protein (TIGR02246 family)